MATTVSKLAALLNGLVQNISLYDETLELSAIYFGNSAAAADDGTQLTKAVLDSLISNSHASGSDNQNVVAGAGLTGGGSGATVTIDVGAGDGITVNANDVAVNSTVIRTTGANAFAANQSMGSNKLTNLANGTAAGDAVNKGQLDAAIYGLSWKDAVRLASAANIASLTGITASDFDGTAQGVTLVTNDRVLLKSQSTASQNGIYYYDGADLVRATDMDGGDEADGAAAFVMEGTYADSGWTQTEDTVTIGTDAQVWVQFTGLGQITAGAGLTKSGNTLDAGDANKGVQVNADSFEIDASEMDGVGLIAGDLGVGGNSWELEIDFGTTGNKAVKASVLSSTSNGEGASLIGIEDAGGNFTSAHVEGALTELDARLDLVEGVVVKAMTAGESFSANVTVAVRMAVNGDTAGRVYKVDPTTTSKSYVIGLVKPSGAVSAGDAINVYLMGEISSSVDFTASQDEGKPVYVTTAGALTLTAPSANSVILVGTVQTVGAGTSKVLIQAPRFVGIA